MDDSYTAKIDGNFDFPLSKDDVSQLDIIKSKKDSFHFLKEDISYHVKIVSSDFTRGLYTVNVNGNEHEVSIQTALDDLIQKMGFAINGAKNVDSISAPMPGLILDISVEVGQEVKEDEQLLVLEAMKMENSITSPRNGVIKKIAVNQGDAVDKKQLLIEFE